MGFLQPGTYLQEITNITGPIWPPYGQFFVCALGAFPFLHCMWKSSCILAVVTPQVILQAKYEVMQRLQINSHTLLCMSSRDTETIVTGIGIFSAIGMEFGGIGMGVYFYTWLSYNLKIYIYEVSRTINSLQDQITPLEDFCQRLLVERSVPVLCWGKNVVSLYISQV